MRSSHKVPFYSGIVNAETFDYFFPNLKIKMISRIKSSFMKFYKNKKFIGCYFDYDKIPKVMSI